MILNTFCMVIALSNLAVLVTKGIYKNVTDNHELFKRL